MYIQGYNIESTWGLYNGAMGIVKEILFDKDKNPNMGHLPLYVAVEMFSYNPPASVPSFDKRNPKVCHHCIGFYLSKIKYNL